MIMSTRKPCKHPEKINLLINEKKVTLTSDNFATVSILKIGLSIEFEEKQ